MGESRSSIVLVFDRLGAGWLGPYGNTWVETPAWNELAAQSLLAEQHLADSPLLELVYRSYWTGVHAACRAAPAGPSLAERLADLGVHTALLTDDPRVAEHPCAEGFVEQTTLPRSLREEAPEDPAETQLAQFVAAAAEWLEQARPPYSLWLHAQAFEGLWDAPYSLRASLVDQEDPPAPTFVAPPADWLDADPDPDLLLGLQQAYGGQALLLDLCLESLLAAVDATDALLLVTSPRGYPLGEHRGVGERATALHAELLQTPLLVRYPDRRLAACRSQELAQPRDVHGLLRRWHEAGREEDAARFRDLSRVVPDPARQLAVSIGGQETAWRTATWFCRLPGSPTPSPDSDHAELYVKPDDRGEFNEVAARREDIVEEFQRLRDAVLPELERSCDAAPLDFEVPELLYREVE